MNRSNADGLFGPKGVSSDVGVDPLTCLDLFCGCGGFTLGMQRAGFHVLAAVDFNAEAVATLRTNLVEHRHPGLTPVAHALQRDLTAFHPEELAALLGADHVDVIVGGPPCQGFSKVRRVDGANNGARLVHDPRRHLYREFLRYVAHFQPLTFVMENVLGPRSCVRVSLRHLQLQGPRHPPNPLGSLQHYRRPFGTHRKPVT